MAKAVRLAELKNELSNLKTVNIVVRCNFGTEVGIPYLQECVDIHGVGVGQDKLCSAHR